MKAIPTKVDGILFRSKLEAHWYECFKRCDLIPIYEPESFSLVHRTDGSVVNYSPDFFLEGKGNGYYVEVKPLKNEYTGHDAKSIRAICMMGYQHPSALLLGSPFRFKGVCIEERYKGSPQGYLVGKPKLPWCASGFYPDEEVIDSPIDLSKLELELVNEMIFNHAADAWNAIQYRHRNS